MKRITCFVACAFGRADVDEIYDNAIEPILRGLDMTPRRVDRMVHNNSVDQKIMELIGTCDLCVADLTYARPSVYYEAGYFGGLGKPVVFTCRGDHFRAKDSDVHDIERVHFDLQMKNIVKWTSTTQVKTFTMNLKKLLRHVAEPLLRDRAAEEAEKIACEKFGAMSPRRRQEVLREIMAGRLEADGWGLYRRQMGNFFHAHDFPAYRKGKKIVALFVCQSGTTSVLKELRHHRVLRDDLRHMNAGQELHLVIVSLRDVPASRLEDVYEDNEPVGGRPGSFSHGVRDEGIACYSHFLSGIRSRPPYERSVDELLKTINGL